MGHNGRARSASQQLAAGPPLPGNVVSLLQAPRDDPEAVTEALRQSPTLSGHLLATVNSPAFGLAERVETIDRAVLMLGASQARRLGLAQAMATLAQSWQLPVELAHAWWRTSLLKAAAARRVCEAVDPTKAGEAYALALMQDLGLLGLLSVDPTFYRERQEPMAGRELIDQEQTHFALDHATAGRSLLIRWQCPKWLWRPTAKHHEGECATDQPVATALRFASLLPHLNQSLAPESEAQLESLYEQAFPEPAPSLTRFLDELSSDVAALGAGGAEATDPATLEAQLLQAAAGELQEAATTVSSLEHRLSSERDRARAFEEEAEHDPLTRTLNRRGLTRQFEREWPAPRDASVPVLAVIGDIDQFKCLNDSHGHAVGDRALRYVSQHLSDHFGSQALVARIGGDEFAIVLTDWPAERAHERVDELAIHLALPVRKAKVPVTLSVGAVHVAEGASPGELDTLLAMADRAMYEHKVTADNGPPFHAAESLEALSPAKAQGATK